MVAPFTWYACVQTQAPEKQKTSDHLALLSKKIRRVSSSRSGLECSESYLLDLLYAFLESRSNLKLLKVNTEIKIQASPEKVWQILTDLNE